MNRVEEIDCEILRYKAEILRLKSERVKAKAEMKVGTKAEIAKPETPKFKHTCPKCGNTWMGWKEVITECRFCKRTLVEAKPVVYEVNYKAIEAIDRYLKEKGSIRYESRDDVHDMVKVYSFTWDGTGVNYVKTENGEEKAKLRVDKIEEVIKNWALEPIMIALGLMEMPIRPKVIVEEAEEDEEEVDEVDEAPPEEEINPDLFGQEG